MGKLAIKYFAHLPNANFPEDILETIYMICTKIPRYNVFPKHVKMGLDLAYRASAGSGLLNEDQTEAALAAFEDVCKECQDFPVDWERAITHPDVEKNRKCIKNKRCLKYIDLAISHARNTYGI